MRNHLFFLQKYKKNVIIWTVLRVVYVKEILKIVNAHPTVQSYLKGIEGYEKSIRKCDKIYRIFRGCTYDDLQILFG